jgi:hypothetical protein
MHGFASADSDWYSGESEQIHRLAIVAKIQFYLRVGNG